jgi:hypothetical protein
LVKNCCDAGTKLPEYYALTTPDGPAFPFNDAPPVALLVYVGTNDFSGGESPALDALYVQGWLDLMSNVTKVYYGTPSSPANITFFAILGPMSPTKPVNATLKAVAEGSAAGYRVVLVNATTACGESLTGCTDGCATHPGVVSHRNIASIVAGAIESVLGWPSPGVIESNGGNDSMWLTAHA